MSKIFISHSSQDNAKALAVAQWLEQNGWNQEYFLDITPSHGLSPGERWQAALKQAADRCQAVLFLISPTWRDSRWCLAEFLFAKQLGKAIFGVLIEDTPLETLPKEMSAEWQLCNLLTGTERWTCQVHDDPLVPKTEISFAMAGLRRLKVGLEKSGLDPSTFPWPPDNQKERSPYRGLKPLEAEDAAVFFGRGTAIVRGVDRIRTLREQGIEQVLVVLGASGSGKSSFLRAGLWPRLKRDDRHFLPLPVIRPERAVITGADGLAASLQAALREYHVSRTRAQIIEELRDGCAFGGLLRELQTRAQERVGNDNVPLTIVIPIDQGEELFSAEGRTEVDQILALLSTVLTTSAKDPKHPEAKLNTLLLVAIRSDSYDRLQAEPHLLEAKKALFDLKPMSRDEFRAVIEGPAVRATAGGQKLTIEPFLTDRLLEDAEGADALPLLAFILERLFIEHGGDGDLRLTEYERLGGIRGSIEAAVNAAFADPNRHPTIPYDEAERNRLLREAFIPWLAVVDPETEHAKRRVARWDDLPERSRPLVNRLIEARLLTRDVKQVADSSRESIVVEVAHEALLRQWPILTTWLDHDAAQLKLAESIRRAAAEWRKAHGEERGEAESWLIHAGERLIDAETLRRRPDYDRLLGQDGSDYIHACRQREDTLRLEREASLKRELELERARAAAAEKAQQESERAREAELSQAQEIERARQAETKRAEAAELARDEATKREAAERARGEEEKRRLIAQTRATRWLRGTIAILVVALGAMIALWYQVRTAEIRKIANLEKMGTILLTNMARNEHFRVAGMVLEDRATLDQFVSSFMSIDNVVYIVITRHDGRILARQTKHMVSNPPNISRSPEPPWYPESESVQRTLLSGPVTTPLITMFEAPNGDRNETILEFAMQVLREPGQQGLIGVVQIGMTYSD